MYRNVLGEKVSKRRYCEMQAAAKNRREPQRADADPAGGLGSTRAFGSAKLLGGGLTGAKAPVYKRAPKRLSSSGRGRSALGMARRRA